MISYPPGTTIFPVGVKFKWVDYSKIKRETPLNARILLANNAELLTYFEFEIDRLLNCLLYLADPIINRLKISNLTLYGILGIILTHQDD